MTDQADNASQAILLDSTLNLAASKSMLELLLSKRDNDVVIDASDVQHLGGPCFQVLLSAQKTWREDGRQFLVVNGSPAFDDGLARFGYPKNQFSEEDTSCL